MIEKIERARARAEAGWAEGKAQDLARGCEPALLAQYEVIFACAYWSGFEAGLVESLAAEVLTVLAARGVAVTADDRARLQRCQDPQVLARWIARAARATSADEVFGSAADA